MTYQLEIRWQDAQGLRVNERFSVGDATLPGDVLTAFKKLSNAKIISASQITPVDVSGLIGNTAAASNVETARQKMVVSMSGPVPLAGSTRPKVRIGIPAPVGTYINGLFGDPTNADIAALKSLVVTNQGNNLDTVDRVFYAK